MSETLANETISAMITGALVVAIIYFVLIFPTRKNKVPSEDATNVSKT